LFSKEISGASPSGIIPLEETAVCLGEQQMCMKQLICDECYVFCSPLPHQVQLTLHISVQPPPTKFVSSYISMKPEDPRSG
jgi:hypothetical protein